MIEFLESYGLWFVLGAVFLLMNLFGIGCCGGRHRHESSERWRRIGSPGSGPYGKSAAVPQDRSEDGRKQGQ